MAAKLGAVLYAFFYIAGWIWISLAAAGFVWSDTFSAFSIFAAMCSLVLAAASWLIGCALRNALTGGDDIMSKINREKLNKGRLRR